MQQLAVTRRIKQCRIPYRCCRSQCWPINAYPLVQRFHHLTHATVPENATQSGRDSSLRRLALPTVQQDEVCRAHAHHDITASDYRMACMARVGRRIWIRTSARSCGCSQTIASAPSSITSKTTPERLFQMAVPRFIRRTSSTLVVKIAQRSNWPFPLGRKTESM